MGVAILIVLMLGFYPTYPSPCMGEGMMLLFFNFALMTAGTVKPNRVPGHSRGFT